MVPIGSQRYVVVTSAKKRIENWLFDMTSWLEVGWSASNMTRTSGHMPPGAPGLEHHSTHMATIDDL
jgi:hypothetical protein